MAFWKTKKIKGHDYYYIYESYYENGKSKQRMLEYVGPLDKVKNMALQAFNGSKSKPPGTATAAFPDVNPVIPPGSGSTTSPGMDSTVSPSTGSTTSPDTDIPPSSGTTNQFSEDLADSSHISIRSYEHGAAMAMYYMAELIGSREIIDEVFPKKMIKGKTRGEVLTLAAIQRAIDPGSKNQFAEWSSQTSLPFYVNFNPEDMDSQAFWEAMDGIDEKMIQEAQNRIVTKVRELLHVDIKVFHLDYTNYFTFIDTKNGRCLVCKRGHNKQKRDDLLQFSVAILTADILAIPFVWEMYDGNKNDTTEFPDFIKLIRQNLEEIGYNLDEVTLVFDGGSNSEENFKDLGFHFICGHSLVSHQDLYEIDLSQYEDVVLKNAKKRKAYRIDHLEFSGVAGTGILTFSEDLKEGQLAQLARDMEKFERTYHSVVERIEKPRSRLFTSLKKRYTEVQHEIDDVKQYNDRLDKEEAARQESGTKKSGKKPKHKEIPVWDELKELKAICDEIVLAPNRYLSNFIKTELLKEGDTYRYSYCLDEKAKEQYIRKYYGKKLTCTTRTEWNTARILEEYTAQECIENDIFRVSKDVHHFSVRPQYHWTDDKIRVHVFCCLCAITIAEVLRKRFEEKGILLTKAKMLDELSTIRDAWITSGQGKKVIRKLEEMDDFHKKCWAVVQEIQTTVNKGK